MSSIRSTNSGRKRFTLKFILENFACECVLSIVTWEEKIAVVSSAFVKFKRLLAWKRKSLLDGVFERPRFMMRFALKKHDVVVVTLGEHFTSVPPTSNEASALQTIEPFVIDAQVWAIEINRSDLLHVSIGKIFVAVFIIARGVVAGIVENRKVLDDRKLQRYNLIARNPIFGRFSFESARRYPSILFPRGCV